MNKLLPILLACPVIASGAPLRAPVGAERALIASVIIAEAGGEGREGMEAVWEVIHTRAKERKLSYTRVVTQRKQFSCLNGTYKTYEKI